MGEDFVVSESYHRGMHGSLLCHYNLLDDSTEEHKIYYDPTDDMARTCSSLQGAHGDYISFEGNARSLVLLRLDRSAGELVTTYHSKTMDTQIRRMMFTLRQLIDDDNQQNVNDETRSKVGMGRRILISPEAWDESYPIPTSDEEQEEEEDPDRYHCFDFMVYGRILFLLVAQSSEYFMLVVDMKSDLLLFAVQFNKAHIRDIKFGGNTFAGGILALRGGNSISSWGVLFGPRLPRLDDLHAKLARLLHECKCSDTSPFHRHPNTRLPLHTLLDLPSSVILCDASDQCLLTDLELDAEYGQLLESKQIVYVDPTGAFCGRNQRWCMRDDDDELPRNEGWLRPSDAVSLICPSPVLDDTCSFAAYLERSSTAGGNFWSVCQQGPNLTLAFGNIGTREYISMTVMATAAMAQALAHYKYYEKRVEGYCHVPGKTAIQTAASGAVAATEEAATEDDRKPPVKKAKTRW